MSFLGCFSASSGRKERDITSAHNSSTEAFTALESACNDAEVATVIHSYLKVKQRHLLRRNDYRPPPELERFNYFTEKLDKLEKTAKRWSTADKAAMYRARILAVKCAYYELLRARGSNSYATLDPLLGVPKDEAENALALVGGLGGERNAALPINWQGSMQLRASAIPT